MLSKSDYAAQFETPRVFGATCGSKEKHNCCIAVTGNKPVRKEHPVKKWGKHSTGLIEEVEQKCDCRFVSSERATDQARNTAARSAKTAFTS